MMSWRTPVLVLIISLAAVPSFCFAAGSSVDYPLYAIVSGNIEPTEKDLEVLAKNFTLAQASFSPQAIGKLHRINPDFKMVLYFNSTYTSKEEDVPRAEKDHRRSLTMFPVAFLKEAIDKRATEFSLLPPAKGKSVSLKASSVDGSLSSGEASRPSTRYYVTWIRIGDELMRINSFDPETGLIEVTRGFDGSKRSSHAAGTRVFSPVYLGSVNDTGAWPGGPGDNLRYAFDPANPAGAQWHLPAMKQAINDGYDGFWLDICSASPFNMCDSDGRGAQPWDFRMGRIYQGDAYCQGQEIKVNTIQNAIRKEFGKWPVVVANNMRPVSFAPGTGGQQQLLISTDLKPRPLDGYCMENFAGGFASRAANRVGKVGPDFHSVDHWRENVQLVMTCSQEKLAAYPMIANAGSKSLMLEGLGDVRDRFESFAWASYLLGVEKDSPTRLGIPAFYIKDGRRFAHIHERYSWPIGTPVETVAPGSIEEYKIKGRQTYQRHFSNGLVLVNPSDADDKVIALDGKYLDPASGKKVTVVEMKAHTGKILLLKQ
jgi:hypothetical protein